MKNYCLVCKEVKYNAGVTFTIEANAGCYGGGDWDGFDDPEFNWDTVVIKKAQCNDCDAVLIEEPSPPQPKPREDSSDKLFKQHYYKNVHALGPNRANVAFSRHAQQRAHDEGITEEMAVDVLHNGKDTPDGLHVVWRETDGIRLVIIKPTPFKGALLVKTLYRVKPQIAVK